MRFSTRTVRSGSVVLAAVSILAFGAVGCGGESQGKNGAGGAGGTTGGASGGGGRAGTGTGGVTGGTSGSGGSGGATSGSAGTSQGRSGAGSGGASGGGAVAGEGGEGGGMEDDRPVLERPVREEYSCAVTTSIDNTGIEWTGGDLATTPGGTFLVWGRPATMAATEGVMLASVSETGMVGTAVSIAAYMGTYSSRPRLTESSRGLSVAWAQAGMNEMSSLHIAELDTMGAVTKMPKAVAGIAERIGDPALAPTASGNALLFVHTAVDYSTMVPQFALLDAGGDLSGDPVDVAMPANQGQTQVGELVVIPGGFAATYTVMGADLDYESLLVFLDAAGSVQGQPILLNVARPYIGQSFLVRGDELIVAHADEVGGYDGSDIAGFISLSRFDLQTHERTAPDIRVQSPTVNEEVVNPVLFSVGEDVGLLWSRGSVIYICGGCMPDNHLEAVVMDGDDLTPLTDMLTFPNDQPMGGYVRPLVAPVGEHFAVVTDLRFHVSGNMASGAFQCTPAP